MTGRASVWSDPRVIELAREFVAASDEVWRLQRGTDAECVFFQEMAEHGHYGGSPGTTRQGIYVCAPSGKFLASVNSNSADRVLSTMQRGLFAWKKLSKNQRLLTDDARILPEHRWEDSYPADGLVLTMFTRDLPEEGGPEQPCEAKWNQDRVWFSKAEARQWLPEDIRPGAKHSLPELLLTRLMRFHLVDTVKGQTSTFSTRELEDSAISVEVVKSAPPLARFEIVGATHAESSRRRRRTSPHGVSTRLLGHGTYHVEQERFTEFEIVALGRRWGRTSLNGRRRDAPEGLLGFVFRLSGPEEPRIAPAFIFSDYADWVTGPRGN